MNLPNVITAALLFGAMALVTYLQQHFGELGIPPYLAPIGIGILASLAKAIAEYQKPKVLLVPDAAMTPRGSDAELSGVVALPQESYWKRVLYK